MERVKQAAFIGYWLRRVSPISAMLADTATIANPSEREILITKSANEFCAFDLAYRLCVLVESRKDENFNRYVRSSNLDENSDLGESDIREYMLRDTRAYWIPQNYVLDACHCLKEKNVSPHAFYLILKGLFLRLQP